MDLLSPPAVRDAGFERALAERPDDRGLRLVYADWLDDQGQDGYARAHRFLARLGRHPVVRPVYRSPQVWDPPLALLGHADIPSHEPDLDPALLPRPVFERLRARARLAVGGLSDWMADLADLDRAAIRALATSAWAYFRSAQVAVEELAAVLTPDD